MFQIMVILRRKAGISIDEFHKHWKEIHGPLFRKFPQIKKYTQYHVSDHARDDNDPSIDGVAILEFESEEAMREAWKMSEYKAVRTDEPNFLSDGAKGIHVVYVDDVVETIKRE